MKAFSHTSKTSGSIISGVPAFSHLFDFYDTNYISILTQAVNEALSEYEKTVRDHARSTWGELANSINIEFDPSTFEVTFSASPEATALEYGDGSRSPTAVLRNAAIEASQQLPSKITAKMAKIAKPA
jgi:hypothetical protein